MPTPEQGYLVLVRDLGSVRLPPFIAFVISSILFRLSGSAQCCTGARRTSIAAAEAAKAEAASPVAVADADEPELRKV